MRLGDKNRSCLPAFCSTCFEKNVAQNRQMEETKLKETLKVKPSSLSWCTWFQKVVSNVGFDFDGQSLPGRAALDKWKAMSEEDRGHWKSCYYEWAGVAVSTPPRKKPAAESPESTEKTSQSVKRLPDMTGPQPHYEGRVETLQSFHKRWAWLEKKMGKAPSSSFFLTHSQEFHELYLDVLELLKKGCFSGFSATPR